MGRMRLLESERVRERSTGGTLASVVLHSVLIGLTVVMTSRAVIQEAPPEQRPEDIVYVAPPEPEPLPPEPEPVVAPPPPPKAAPPRPTPPRPEPPRPKPPAPVPAAPISVPDAIPDISVPLAPMPDVTAPLVDPSEFKAGLPTDPTGTSTGTPGGTPGGLGSGDNTPYDANTVEVPVRARGGNPSPRYPSTLERQGVGGEVIVQFIVGTNGRIEMGSVEIVSATNEQFEQAVRAVLPRLRFEPGKVGGRAVRQLVQLPFVFAPRS